jgi:hypothetical protein
MHINLKSKPGAQREIARGIYMPLPSTATITGISSDDDDALLDVVMDLDLTADGVRPVSFSVSTQDGAPITGTTLRSIRLWDLVRQVIVDVGIQRGEAKTLPNGETQLALKPATLPRADAERLKHEGPTDETLSWVAFFYNLAGILGLPPAKQVELTLDLAPATASRWVRRARNNGLIEER